MALKMKAPANTLLLDFGGVISESLFETTSSIEQAFALEAGALDWSGPLQNKVDALWQRMRAGELSERDYWYTRAQQLSSLVGEQLSIQDIINKSRPRIDDICRAQAVSAIEAARVGGATVAVLTNELLLFYGSDRVNDSSVVASFDHIFDASYTKIMKPDPRAYAMVVTALEVKPEQIVFVDDQLANVEGGERAGFQSIHLDLNQPNTAFDTALRLLNLN